MNITLMSPVSLESLKAQWIEIHTPAGNFVIQEGHAPMVLSLKDQEPLIIGLSQGNERIFILKNGGIIYINRHEVTILIDNAP